MLEQVKYYDYIPRLCCAKITKCLFCVFCRSVCSCLHAFTWCPTSSLPTLRRQQSFSQVSVKFSWIGIDAPHKHRSVRERSVKGLRRIAWRGSSGVDKHTDYICVLEFLSTVYVGNTFQASTGAVQKHSSILSKYFFCCCPVLDS